MYTASREAYCQSRSMLPNEKYAVDREAYHWPGNILSAENNAASQMLAAVFKKKNRGWITRPLCLKCFIYVSGLLNFTIFYHSQFLFQYFMKHSMKQFVLYFDR